jgi:hypothetical protein
MISNYAKVSLGKQRVRIRRINKETKFQDSRKANFDAMPRLVKQDFQKVMSIEEWEEMMLLRVSQN